MSTLPVCLLVAVNGLCDRLCSFDSQCCCRLKAPVLGFVVGSVPRICNCLTTLHVYGAGGLPIWGVISQPIGCNVSAVAALFEYGLNQFAIVFHLMGVFASVF